MVCGRILTVYKCDTMHNNRIIDNYGNEQMQDPWPSIHRLDKKTGEHEAKLAVYEHRITSNETAVNTVIVSLGEIKELLAHNKGTGSGVKLAIGIAAWFVGTSFTIIGLIIAAKAAGVI